MAYDKIDAELHLWTLLQFFIFCIFIEHVFQQFRDRGCGTGKILVVERGDDEGVILKHAILRSSFHYDEERDEWRQRIEPLTDEGFTFVTSQGVKSIEAGRYLIKQEYAMDLFDIKRGRLVRLHIVHRDDAHDDRNDSEYSTAEQPGERARRSQG